MQNCPNDVELQAENARKEKKLNKGEDGKNEGGMQEIYNHGPIIQLGWQ